MQDRKMIGLSETSIGEEEARVASEVLHSGWLSQGEKVAQFEQAVGQSLGVEAIAVSSCTAGLHLVLAGLGVGAGDEVLVPGVTFIATVNAVLYTGATAVPVDICPGTPHMSIDTAMRAVTPRTKAIVIMHFGGYKMDIGPWRDFADSHNLYLVEDAAHCPGLGVGTKSNAAVLSFFANKNMTTAEGGMILVKSAEFAARLKRMRGHGMTTTTLSRASGHAYTYDVDMLGWNYRLDEIRAAIGLVQFGKLEQFNSRRRELTMGYRKLLAHYCPNVKMPFEADWPTLAHLMTILLPQHYNRSTVMQKMRDSGIQTSIHYPMYHKFTWHKNLFTNACLPNTEEWCTQSLTLPLHPSLTDGDVKYVVTTLAQILLSNSQLQ